MVNRSDIETFWTRGDIHSRIHEAMSEAGLNDRKLEIEDLFPIDQYHARGIAATVDLGKRMPISENQRIIDIGCGLGGPARYFAKQFKCFITGIDITPSFIEIGNKFNKLTSMSKQVSLQIGNGETLDFEGEMAVIMGEGGKHIKPEEIEAPYIIQSKYLFIECLLLLYSSSIS